MTKLFPLFVLAAAFSFNGAIASSELDPKPTTAAPSGLIVQTDSNGNSQVFKADGIAQVNSAQTAEAAVVSFATAANLVSHVVAESELDRTSSTESWYYYFAPTYNPYCSYNYGFNYYGYNYNYRPYYNWNYSGFTYYYYYRF